MKSSTPRMNTSTSRASINSNDSTNHTKQPKSTTTLRNIEQLSRRSTRSTTSTKLSTTSTNNTNVKEITRATRSTSTQPSATSTGSKKRRTVDSHFHEVGKICGNNKVRKRKKSKFQLGSDSDSSSKSDLDSEYVDKLEEENGSMDTNEGNSTGADVPNTITQNDTNNDNSTKNNKTNESFSSSNRNEKTWDDMDFGMFIEDGSFSGISDVMEDNENKKKTPTKLTIAGKIIRSRKPSSTYTKEAVATSVTEKEKVTKTSDLDALLSQFNLPNHWTRVIPSFKIRENAPDIRTSSSKASFGRLVSLSTRLVETLLKTICPGPGYNGFKLYVLSKLVQKSHQNHQTQTEDSSQNPKLHQHVRTESEKIESVISCLCAWSNKSKKRSIERRVIRAILNKSFLKHEIKDMKKK